jgi:hypothetical protein
VLLIVDEMNRFISVSAGEVIPVRFDKIDRAFRLTSSQLLAMYGKWLKYRSKGSLSEYQVFLSYRQGNSKSGSVKELFDTSLVTDLFDTLSFKLRVNSEDIMVFRDTNRLPSGEDFQSSFAKALLHSEVMVPLVSVYALQRMFKHTLTSNVDNVLVEWILGIVCMKISSEGGAEMKSKIRLNKVFPVMIGSLSVSVDNDESVAGIGEVANLFSSKETAGGTAVLESLPEIVPVSTMKKVRDLLAENGLDSSHPLIAPVLSMTVKEIVDKLTKFNGFLGWEVPVKSLAARAAGEVVRILRELGAGGTFVSGKLINLNIFLV